MGPMPPAPPALRFGRLPVYLWAVVMMASTTSIIRCKAESVPMVMSVPQKSLSMEPTIPTTLRCACFSTASLSILPADDTSHTARHWEPPISPLDTQAGDGTAVGRKHRILNTLSIHCFVSSELCLT